MGQGGKNPVAKQKNCHPMSPEQSGLSWNKTIIVNAMKLMMVMVKVMMIMMTMMMMMGIMMMMILPRNKAVSVNVLKDDWQRLRTAVKLPAAHLSIWT